jgi:MFS family permease
MVEAPPTAVRADVVRLFATRALRLFAYGALSVVLVFHLTALGFSAASIGLLLTLTLLGDTALSLVITTRADLAGRRRMLLVGASLMVGAGLLFAVTADFWLLLLAATLGIISPSGNEVGPFLAIEQAALAQAVPPERRTAIFAWYTLTGAFATAAGAAVGGGMAEGLQRLGWTPLQSYRAVIVAYALVGAALAVGFAGLTPAVEAPARQATARPPLLSPALGLHRSRGVVLKLSGLFALDALAGGFILQSFVAWWLHQRFGAGEGLIGAVFFGANVLAGLSALSAASLAKRFGLVNTMVFTHLPSNLLLLLVPFMPSLWTAVAVLFARFSISQMDVPTRQSYTMAVVDPGERAAAAGVTGIARTVGASLSPLLAGPLYAAQALPGTPALLASLPFLICGGLKIAYDLLLWRAFSRTPAPEEARQ